MATGEAPPLPLYLVDSRNQNSYIGSSVVEPATTSDLDDVARWNIPRYSSHSPMVQLYSTQVQLPPLLDLRLTG